MGLFLSDLPCYFPILVSQFSHSLMSDSLQPHGLQHARLPCPLPTPGAYSNTCPSHWSCHPTILCCPLFLPPSIFPSLRVFSSESVFRISWPKIANTSRHLINICLLLLNSYMSHCIPVLKTCEGGVAYNRP